MYVYDQSRERERESERKPDPDIRFTDENSLKSVVNLSKPSLPLDPTPFPFYFFNLHFDQINL